MDAAQATRLLPVVTERISRYLGYAAYVTPPTAIVDEAAIRAAGYLAGQQYGAISETIRGPADGGTRRTTPSWFRNSGAESLLTHYKVRRGGAV